MVCCTAEHRRETAVGSPALVNALDALLPTERVVVADGGNVNVAQPHRR